MSKASAQKVRAILGPRLPQELDNAIPSNGEGNNSSFVGTLADAPDVFIKVVQSEDKYLDYARAIMDGFLSGDIFPEIYSITDLGDECVVLMEVVNTFETENHELKNVHDHWNGLSQALKMRSEFGNKTLLEWCLAMEEEVFTGPHGKDLEALACWVDNQPNMRHDVHAGNIGYRSSTEDMVLLDPVW